MKFFLISIGLLFGTVCAAQSLKQNIEKAYNNFKQDEQLRYGISSLTVLNSQTGEIVFSDNDRVGLAPASTLKVITAASVLAMLGPNFKWTTTLGYSGQLSMQGILTGNIVITGGGDPTLGSSRFPMADKKILLEKWIAVIQQAGIKSINGRVLVDDRLFGTQTLPNGWIWQDMGNYFGAGSSAVSWNDNQFEITFQPADKIGNAAKVTSSDPKVPYLKIINEVLTGAPGSGDKVYAYAAPYADVIYIRGTYGIDLKKTISIALPDPAFEIAFCLQESLMQKGIVVTNSPSTARRLTIDSLSLANVKLSQFDQDLLYGHLKTLYKHSSPSIVQVCHTFNQKSINLYGEVFLKTLAWKQAKPITTDEGVKIVKAYWSDKLGLDIRTLNMIDGSGLSPATHVTSHSIAAILSASKKETWFSSFYNSLPSNNNMTMKSGYINDVLAYAGYQKTQSGMELSFSFIVNNYTGSTTIIKQKMFAVLNKLKK